MSEFCFHVHGRISFFVVLPEDGDKAILRSYADKISIPENKEIPRNILTYETNVVNLYNYSLCALTICYCKFLLPKTCTITWEDNSILF
jgi:hypothetical protein